MCYLWYVCIYIYNLIYTEIHRHKYFIDAQLNLHIRSYINLYLTTLSFMFMAVLSFLPTITLSSLYIHEHVYKWDIFIIYHILFQKPWNIAGGGTPPNRCIAQAVWLGHIPEKWMSCSTIQFPTPTRREAVVTMATTLGMFSNSLRLTPRMTYLEQ